MVTGLLMYAALLNYVHMRRPLSEQEHGHAYMHRTHIWLSSGVISIPDAWKRLARTAISGAGGCVFLLCPHAHQRLAHTAHTHVPSMVSHQITHCLRTCCSIRSRTCSHQNVVETSDSRLVRTVLKYISGVTTGCYTSKKSTYELKLYDFETFSTSKIYIVPINNFIIVVPVLSLRKIFKYL